MTHVATVSSMKGINTAPRLNEPTPGTRIRRLWDKLQANRGLMVELTDLGYHRSTTGTHLNHDLERLRDSWGLDIRVKRRGGIKGRRGQLPALYCLVGEWDGKVYIDYVAERHQNR